MISKFSKSLTFAWQGLCITWREELNFKIQLALGILAIIGSYALQVTHTEFAIIALTIFFVLAIEGLNTALEELCDKFQPTHDPHIAKIKDLGAAAALLSSIGALAVAAFIFGPRLVPLDHLLETWLEGVRAITWLNFFSKVTWLGDEVLIGALSGILALVLLIKRCWQRLKGFVVTMAGAAITTEVLKIIIARPRPAVTALTSAFATETSYSFPSGHAAAAIAFYSFLVWLVCQHLPKGPAHRLIAYLALIIILAVGLSRLYLGVHYLTDVLAGYLVGISWLLVGIHLIKPDPRSRIR